MQKLPNVSALYAPVQPGLKQAEEGVVYRECLPHPGLQEMIYCYWELKTAYPLNAPYQYRVVADGCIDIFFEWHDPAKAVVMGFTDAYTEFPLPAVFHYVGVRFLPGMFPALYNVNAAELAHKETNLADITTHFLPEGFPEGTALTDIKPLLDKHFLRLLSSKNLPADNRFYESLDLIFRTAGMVSIERELPRGISSRQLRRLFAAYIGDTPKAFSNVVRFQHLLRSPLPVLKNRLYLDAGYYDQAHFIKVFKELYGLTPSQVFDK